MSRHVFNEVQQRSDEWFDQRRGMVTASVVGQLITGKTLAVANNDYSRGLVAQLVAERITGFVEPGYINGDMMRGLDEEPRARDLYAEHSDLPVTTCGFMTIDGDGWSLGCSPDGLVGDIGMLEIKAPRGKGHVQTVLADAVPERYVPQCQAALLVSGREWLDFVSFHGGSAVWTKRVYPDPRWQEAIIAACRAFEESAAEMVARYEAAVAGLPVADRLPDLYAAELKLA